MYYFAYGSNLSQRRLQQRVPSAKSIATCKLVGHQLRFHKAGRDQSAKCDACLSSDANDLVFGVLYEIIPEEKHALDLAEGLGSGYEIKTVSVQDNTGKFWDAFTYYATAIDPDLKPFSWYVNHVLLGAAEAGLPRAYIQTIENVESVEDPDPLRNAREREIHY